MSEPLGLHGGGGLVSNSAGLSASGGGDPTFAALAPEIRKQISLGHTQFCLGVHEDGQAEWEPWTTTLLRVLDIAGAATQRGFAETVARLGSAKLEAAFYEVCNLENACNEIGETTPDIAAWMRKALLGALAGEGPQ